MLKNNSKNKGNGFERVICRSLSKWASGDDKEELFWRSSSSGATATVGRRKGKTKTNQDGDIVATDESTMWVTNNLYFECKTYKSVDFLGFITGKGNLWGWLNKLKMEAKECKKIPVLIFKQNRSAIFIIIENSFFLKLDNYCDLRELDKVCLEKDDKKYIMLKYDSFLDSVDAEILKINL